MNKKVFLLLALSLLCFTTVLASTNYEEWAYNYEDDTFNLGRYIVNETTLNVNNSQFLQGLTPTQVANLYSELWTPSGSDI